MPSYQEMDQAYSSALWAHKPAEAIEGSSLMAEYGSPMYHFSLSLIIIIIHTSCVVSKILSIS